MQAKDICFFGKMRSGKDETAFLLSQYLPCEKMAFGDELKRQFHLDYPHIPREPKPRNYDSFSPLQKLKWTIQSKPILGYQEYGQARRKDNPDVWVNALVRNYINRKDKNPNTHFLVTDMRQPNEYKALKELGFIMVKVEADEETRIKRMLANGEKPVGLNHETESYVDGYDYDYIIYNNTEDKEQLRQEVLKLVDFIVYPEKAIEKRLKELEKFLKKITKENKHEEIEFGIQGREII